MRQKTINLRNQGSFDKIFFPQSLSCIPRWVRLVQKTRAKNSHAWAPLMQKYKLLTQCSSCCPRNISWNVRNCQITRPAFNLNIFFHNAEGKFRIFLRDIWTWRAPDFSLKGLSHKMDLVFDDMYG